MWQEFESFLDVYENFFYKNASGCRHRESEFFFCLDQLVNISLDSVYTMEYYQTINVSFTSFFISIGPYLYAINKQKPDGRTQLFSMDTIDSQTLQHPYSEMLLPCWRVGDIVLPPLNLLFGSDRSGGSRHYSFSYDPIQQVFPHVANKWNHCARPIGNLFCVWELNNTPSIFVY